MFSWILTIRKLEPLRPPVSQGYNPCALGHAHTVDILVNEMLPILAILD